MKLLLDGKRKSALTAMLKCGNHNPETVDNNSKLLIKLVSQDMEMVFGFFLL